MNTQTDVTSPAAKPVDVFSVLLMIWGHRRAILIVTFLTTMAGVAWALLASPVYYSEATVAPREGDDGRSSTANLIAQLGSVGGMVAARLGGGGNLDRVEIILNGYELAETVIRKHDLLPMLFPELWDADAGKWKGGPAKAPSLRLGAKKLREERLSISVNSKKGMFTIGMRANDSVMAKKLVDYYLESLSEKVRQDVIRNAEGDRQYLESQLAVVTDPVLRERLQGLIAAQIEKVMLVRSQVYDVLEKPMVPLERKSPKRKKIVMLAFFFGIFGSIAGIFGRRGYKAFRSALAARIPV